MHSKQERKKKPINEPNKKRKHSVKKSLKFSFYVVTLKMPHLFIYLLSQFQNNVLNATESTSFRYFRVAYGAIINLPGMKVSMGFYRQSSNGLTIHHRQPSKDVIFNRQPPKIQSTINRQKVSRCFKSYYFS